LECEKRKCTVVEKTTEGFQYIHDARKSAAAVKNCADMIQQYLS